MFRCSRSGWGTCPAGAGAGAGRLGLAPDTRAGTVGRSLKCQRRSWPCVAAPGRVRIPHGGRENADRAAPPGRPPRARRSTCAGPSGYSDRHRRSNAWGVAGVVDVHQRGGGERRGTAPWARSAGRSPGLARSGGCAANVGFADLAVGVFRSRERDVRATGSPDGSSVVSRGTTAGNEPRFPSSTHRAALVLDRGLASRGSSDGRLTLRVRRCALAGRELAGTESVAGWDPLPRGERTDRSVV